MTEYQRDENNVSYMFTSTEQPKEVMRITRDGVWVDPDIPVEEAVKAVLDALDYQVKTLVQRAVLDERERIVNLLITQHEMAKGAHNYWHVAAQLIQADVASDT